MTSVPLSAGIPLGVMHPMLATASTGQGNRRPRTIDQFEGTHAFELKIDGVRALIRKIGDEVFIYNRSLVQITSCFPEVVAAMQAAPFERIVLDCEIVGTGTMSFGDLMRRVKQTSPTPALLAKYPVRAVAFDILNYGPLFYDMVPYTTRRELLQAVVPEIPAPFEVVPASMDGLGFYDKVKAAGLEGLIAKQLVSVYTSGRQPTWVKFKTTRTITCVAVSYEKGNGARADFGAVHLALIDPTATAPTYVGRVGSGFSRDDITRIKGSLDRQEFPLVEVETLGRTKENRLRFPVFKGLRLDLSVADATVKQLDTLSLQ